MELPDNRFKQSLEINFQSNSRSNFFESASLPREALFYELLVQLFFLLPIENQGFTWSVKFLFLFLSNTLLKMPHSHSNIWTHLVLWTKDHAPVITSEMAVSIKHVLEELPLDFYEKQTHLSVLPNHIHLLIKLPGNLSVDQLAHFVQQLICKKLVQEGFANCPEWDEKYYAHSVSLNRLSTEKSLLDRQEYKHKEISLEEELKFLGL